MPGKLIFALMVTLSVAAFDAQAEHSYVDIEQRLTAEQLRATGLDTLSPAQLELLNQLLRDAPVKVSKTENSQRQDDPVLGSNFGHDDQPIKSRLLGSVSGWEPGTVFELENGQRWKVLKGSAKLPKPLLSPAVVVAPGFAGRWFLQVHEDLPRARVYRIE